MGIVLRAPDARFITAVSPFTAAGVTDGCAGFGVVVNGGGDGAGGVGTVDTLETAGLGITEGIFWSVCIAWTIASTLFRRTGRGGAAAVDFCCVVGVETVGVATVVIGAASQGGPWLDCRSGGTSGATASSSSGGGVSDGALTAPTTLATATSGTFVASILASPSGNLTSTMVGGAGMISVSCIAKSSESSSRSSEVVSSAPSLSDLLLSSESSRLFFISFCHVLLASLIFTYTHSGHLPCASGLITIISFSPARFISAW